MNPEDVRPAIPAGPPQCHHYMCRCMWAIELASNGLLLEAIELHRLQSAVQCRLTRPDGWAPPADRSKEDA